MESSPYLKPANSDEEVPKDAPPFDSEEKAGGETVSSLSMTDDPLNWTSRKKWAILLIVSLSAFLADFGSSLGAGTLISQAKYWKTPVGVIMHSLEGNLFMLGAGGIVVVALSSYWGRLPLLLYFLVGALATAIWSAAGRSFDSFMAGRILNGFFSTVAQAGGLMFIQDMYEQAQHARKINIWSAFIILSPYLGPFTGTFISWKATWRWAYGVQAILSAVCLVLVLLFVDETYYERTGGEPGHRQSRLARLFGIEQRKNHLVRRGFKNALIRPAVALSKLPVLLCTIYYFFTFPWVIGLNATISIFVTSVYGFGPEQIGFYYMTPMVATIIGEVVGHWLHDFLANIYKRRHNGHFEPEARLIAMWIATPFMLVGVTGLGFSLFHGWHYMVSAVLWGLYVFGIMIVTTAVNAYLLDAYPEGAGEVAAWINFGRSLGGFVVIYVENPWAAAIGVDKSLGTQAAIILAAFSIVVFLQFYGKRLRQWQGQMNF